MKRVFRITIILLPVVVISAGIGLWRHHYLKIMNAEPEKVFHIPGQSSDSTTDANTSKVKLVNREDNTDAMAKRNHNPITPEEMDNKGNLSVGPTFSDIIAENLPPEALAALREYEHIQSTYPGVRRELIPLYKAWPSDENAINAVWDRMRALKQRRKEALKILAKHSDEAFNELQATIAREENVARQIAEIDREAKERQAARDAQSEERAARHAESKASHAEWKANWEATKERWAKSDKLSDKKNELFDRYKEISDTILKMTPGSIEQKQARKEMNEINEELQKLSKSEE